MPHDIIGLPKNIIESCEIKKCISERLVGIIEAVWLEIVWLSLGFSIKRIIVCILHTHSHASIHFTIEAARNK